MKCSLGTVQFGMDYGISNHNGKINLDEAYNILNYCKENSIEHLDTAHSYGDSEQVLGKLLATDDRFSIMTKIPVMEPYVPTDIEGFFEESLTRLGKRKVRSLLFHSENDLIGKKGEAYCRELEKLKTAGKVEQIGCSFYNTEALETALQNFDLDVVQIPLGPFVQDFYTSGLLAELNKRKIEVHVRSIFLQGLAFMKLEDLPSFFNPIKDKLEKYWQIMNDQNIGPAVFSYSFLKKISGVDFCIVGTTRKSEIEENINALEHPVIDIDFSEFDLGDRKFKLPYLWKLK